MGLAYLRPASLTFQTFDYLQASDQRPSVLPARSMEPPAAVHPARPGGTASSDRAEPPKASSSLSLLNREISYRACISVFLFVIACAVLTPFKEYYLGSYVTKPFDEVRDDVVARKLHHLGVITSGVHYFDTFDRKHLPLIDSTSQARLTRVKAASLGIIEFLVRANVRRSDLLAGLPPELLTRPVNLMEDVYGPICGPSSKTAPQLLFGNWFPAIRHEFCRDYKNQFPRDRFFNSDGQAPVDRNLSSVGQVTLGLIAVVNMSEIYLRHFDDALVVRKIMKNVQEGYVGLELPGYTDDVANAIVDHYAKGMPLSKLIELLPRSLDDNHIALVDVLGVSHILAYYLTSQQLTMGINVNGEAAIMAEVTHATATYFSADFVINTVGMHLISTMHLAPFWDCAIHHTTMEKTITVADVDAAAILQCGRDRASIIPIFAVNLMFLFQKNDRDYAKLDNTTTYTLGPHREADAEYVPLVVPEKLADSQILSLDGTAWTKARVPTSQALPPTTPYGYLYTPDCRALVETVMLQSGRNVQKYQAYLGDGLGNCAFRDSQETPSQTLCRLFMNQSELLFKALNGSLIPIPRCDSLTSGLSADLATLQQSNFRQIEWFMIDTDLLSRRIRIQDNTSRQIRTFLLILNLIGATYYVIEYLGILRSVWVFIRNSIYRAPASSASRAKKYTTTESRGIRLAELLQCDPSVGALHHPGTMVLLYLGAVGALSNIFSLGCTAQLSTAQGGVVIFCKPSISASSPGLVFMTLSSSYWVIRVTLQTKSFSDRLAHALREDFVRFWVVNAIAVLVIHFTCKLSADFVFENVELHSDPHIYAIFGGLAVTWIIATGFLLAQTISTDASKLKRMLRRRSVELARRASYARSAKERAFLAKWSTSQLDSVLHNCSSPQIAHELESLSHSLKQKLTKSGRMPSQTQLKTSTGSEILIHEFVAVHCAAGAHAHLQAVVWELQQDGSGVCRSLFEPKATVTASATGVEPTSSL